MVRFIKLLQDELDAGNRDSLKQAAKKILEENESLAKGKVKKVSMINIEGDYIVSRIMRGKEKKYKQFYYELLLIAQFTLEKVRNKKKVNSPEIKNVIERIVNEFSGEDYYNRLLAYTYLHTSDNFIIGHMVNCAILTVGFSSYLGLKKKDLVKIGICAFLHDVAMIHYFRLVNQDRKLTDAEFEEMKKHTEQSAAVLRTVISDNLESVVTDVHEREMGQGYPKGKKGEELSVWTKIISICDIYTSLTHVRSHRNDFNPFTAIRMIIGMKGEQFDERLIKQFVDYLSIYPINSFVYLNTGEIAQVFRSNPGSPTKPVVQIIVTQDNHLEHEFKLIDLKDSALIHIKGVVSREKEKEIMSILIAKEGLQEKGE